jgi:hypothetical protein
LEGQAEEGLIEARKAVELEPTRTHYDTLAMALAISGQSGEALQIETQDVMVGGDVAINSERVTLGMVYYAAGRKQEAHAQWEIARTGSEVQAQKLATEFEAKYR